VNITAFPPGSACGQRWVISLAAASSFVSGSREPPVDDTRINADRGFGAK
jgi:hypothetical protein